MKTVQLSHDYAVAPHELWSLCTSLDALAIMMEGLVTFEGLPQGHIYTGQDIDVQVSLFGKLPKQPYHMRVVECDASAMRVRSFEVGAGVKSWQHTMTVEKIDSGSRLNEIIEIDAGWLTWAFAAWARFLYKKRHAPRQRLLETSNDAWPKEAGDFPKI